MPWWANCFDSGVLSQTPGNFLAEKTVNDSLKQDARIGALPVFTLAVLPATLGIGATLTNENLSLEERQV